MHTHITHRLVLDDVYPIVSRTVQPGAPGAPGSTACICSPLKHSQPHKRLVLIFMVVNLSSSKSLLLVLSS